MTGTRRLAAIMAVDVAGYSRLMGEDEAGTARAVRERRDAARPIVATHGGRIVKTMGDGVLLEFPSVVAAVECAIGVQQLMAELNAGLPENKRIIYRIGINLGDVLIEGDDILGDGVNIAARVESIAEPGGICLSDFAYQQVRGKVAAEFSDLGERELKNIARPVRVFALDLATTPLRPKPGAMADGLATSRRWRLVPALAALAVLAIVAAGAWFFLAGRHVNIAANAPAHLSIVVLPFANLSNDPKQDYFADGITENLTTDLSRIRNSFVIARNTAFTYKGKSVDAKEIGKDLGVRYVLEGSVQRDGNRVRVNAQLIDAESGAHLWADRFEEDLADLFKLQDQVVARLANQLDSELIAAAALHAAKAPNPDTIDFYFQGMARFNLGGPANLKDARGFFERALALDPGNVDALVGTASVDAMIGSRFFTEDRAARLASAEDALGKVLSRAPEYALAHMWLGVVQIYTNRAAQGIAECERALALDQNLADAHAYIGFGEYASGHGEETEAHVREALRLSPRDTTAYSWMTIAGSVKEGLGADEEAVAWLHRAIEANRNFPLSHLFLASALAQRGRLDEARAEARAGLALDPTFTIRRFRAGASSDNPRYLAQHERLAEGMRKAGLPEDEGPRLSIVVLPFQNLSGDPKQDYLADVLTDELTTYISRIPGSFVIARNTAFTYKGKPTDVKIIGKDLGVRYALEGSVQPTDKRIRTNAQLIDTETGAHLWAEQFDTDKTDLLQTQDEIVVRLARTLQIQLTDIEAAKLERAHPANPDAQDLAMQCAARVQHIPAGKEMDADLSACDRALALDPNNVLAMQSLAFKIWARVNYGQSVDRTADIRDAERLIARALALDPNNAQLYWIESSVFSLEQRFDEAAAVAARSIALDPSDINAYWNSCLIQYLLGKPEQVLDCIDKAIRLSPRDVRLPVLIAFKGNANFMLGRYEQALEWYRQSLALNPNDPLNNIYLTAALSLAGHESDAYALLERYLATASPKSPRTIAAVMARRISRNPLYLATYQHIGEGLRKAGMPEQ